MKKEADSFWGLSAFDFEVPLDCIQNHIAKLVPSVPLGRDGGSVGNRDVATIRILRDVEEEFAHLLSVLPLRSARNRRYRTKKSFTC